MINPSSKMSLKMSCLQSCNGDVKRAEELYKFLADGVDTLPDFDPVKPSVLKQVTDAANGMFGWVKENQNDIMQAVGFIRQMRGGAATSATSAALSTSEIPPLPEPNTPAV